jgi:hypothetical protein
MREAHRRRPQDFKRKILEWVSTKDELIKAEQRWLDMIDVKDFGDRYYNKTKDARRGRMEWNETQRNAHSEIIKKKFADPEYRKKYEEGQRNKDLSYITPEVLEKRRQSMIKTMAEKFPPEQRKQRVKAQSKEHRRLNSEGVKRAYANMSEEKKKERGRKISETLKKQSPELRKKRSEAAKKMWIRRKANAI